MRHDAHHLDIHTGNHATITLLYDWLFGTLETHPLALAATEASAAWGLSGSRSARSRRAPE